MKKHFNFILLIFLTTRLFAQELTYADLNITSGMFKSELLKSDNYFNNYPHNEPYFQGKTDNKYLKFYNSTGPIVTIDFKNRLEYLTLIQEVQNNANFHFKFCTDYAGNVVYNYQTSNGNKLRFNFNEMRISVEYPSSTNKFLESNFEFVSISVCTSENAYAYHTNIKCEGLANCEAKITQVNIKEAKKLGYKFCQICTSDRISKIALKETLQNNGNTKNIYENSEIETTQNYVYEYDDESYNHEDYITPSQIIEKAEQKFKAYLPTILKSKGEGAFVDMQRTYVGDFTNDGIDDVIIWFNYSFGGNSIAGMECAFYETIGNDVKVVAGFEPDYIFLIEKISNGVVYGEQIFYAKDDPHCCPSIHIPIKLIYKNNKIYVEK